MSFDFEAHHRAQVFDDIQSTTLEILTTPEARLLLGNAAEHMIDRLDGAYLPNVHDRTVVIPAGQLEHNNLALLPLLPSDSEIPNDTSFFTALPEHEVEQFLQAYTAEGHTNPEALAQQELDTFLAALVESLDENDGTDMEFKAALRGTAYPLYMECGQHIIATRTLLILNKILHEAGTAVVSAGVTHELSHDYFRAINTHKNPDWFLKEDVEHQRVTLDERLALRRDYGILDLTCDGQRLPTPVEFIPQIAGLSGAEAAARLFPLAEWGRKSASILTSLGLSGAIAMALSQTYCDPTGWPTQDEVDAYKGMKLI